MNPGNNPHSESMQNKYDILVRVETNYIEDQSDPETERYVFAYTITITNAGTIAARLLRRHWTITDADNKVQEVHGDGVVGDQPHLLPGQSYRYTSGTMLDTPVGTMGGNYDMLADDGMEFEAQIPDFSLAVPHILH